MGRRQLPENLGVRGEDVGRIANRRRVREQRRPTPAKVIVLLEGTVFENRHQNAAGDRLRLLACIIKHLHGVSHD